MLLAEAAFTVTLRVTVMSPDPPVPPAATLTLTVFVPDAVEYQLPVVTPLAFVDDAGCVMVTPVVVDTLIVADLPLNGFPNASVTVMLTDDGDDPLLAVIGLLEVNVETDVLYGPGFTVTDAVGVIAPTVTTVAVTVLDSALVDDHVPVTCPLALVRALGWFTVLPVPRTAKVTESPLRALPN